MKHVLIVRDNVEVEGERRCIQRAERQRWGKQTYEVPSDGLSKARTVLEKITSDRYKSLVLQQKVTVAAIPAA